LSRRALIIGQDRDYCYVLREFLALRELYVTVVLDYKEGLDRLFYEKPDLTIFESSGPEPVRACVDAIRESNEFEIVDFGSGQAIRTGTKSVLFFDDKSRINSLFDFLKSGFSQPQPEQPPDTGDEGSLECTFYPSLLVDINLKKKSGVLSITSSTNLIIYFINGNPVFAEGGDIETAIGRILLNSGKIDEETYEKAVDIASKNKQKFGQILFEMGITSPHELNSFLEFQMQEKILKGFYYIKGKYVFKSGDEFADRIVLYQVDVSKVIYEGVKRYIDVNDLEEANPAIIIDPKLRTDINSLGLKPKELRFVQLLKDRATVREVLEGSRLERPEALKLLYFLSLFRLVKMSGISPDDIGRASIEKRIRESETGPGVSGAQEFHSDMESVFAELKELESEESPEVGLGTGHSETVDEIVHQGEEQEPEAKSAAGNSHAFESRFGFSEGASEPEVPLEGSPNSGFESPGPSAYEENNKEEEYYILDTEGEEPQAGEPQVSPPVYEIELDLGPEAGENGQSAWGEAPTTPQFQEPARPGGEDREGAPDTDQYPSDQGNESGLSALFQPYGDVNEGGEIEKDTETPAGGVEFIFTGQSAGFESPAEKESDTAGKEHSSGFSDRVAGFHSAIGDKDYYEILGVSRDSTVEEIRDSYYQLVKHYHPDVNPNADQETRAKAEEIFTRITTAYETLSQGDKRSQYDSHEELSALKSQAKYIYEAEMTFKKGITLLIQRNYTEAEKHLREAVQMNPDEAAYLGAHGWTRFLAAEDKMSVLQEVRSCLENAIKMNDKIPENYYYMGCVYKHTNDLRNAAKYFEKAIEIDPDYIEAKREVRLINTRRTNITNDKKIEKNFWSSLFKK
jgi:tetratricopeptide (TPR) repeat protein